MISPAIQPRWSAQENFELNTPLYTSNGLLRMHLATSVRKSMISYLQVYEDQ